MEICILGSQYHRDSKRVKRAEIADEFGSLPYVSTIHHLYRGRFDQIFNDGQFVYRSFECRQGRIADMVQAYFFHTVRYLRSHPRISLLYTMSLNSSLLGILASKVARTKAIMRVGVDWNEMDRKFNPLLRKFLKIYYILSLRLADGVHANANHLADKIYEMAGVRPHVIYPQLKIERYVSIVRNSDVKKRKKIILYVGRLDPVKGPHYAIWAMPSILKAIKDCELWIVGSDLRNKDMKSDLEKLANELSCHKKVRFFGWIPHKEIVTYYAKADLVVLPSKHEGFNHVMAEALASALPVVASKIPSHEEFIKSDFGVVVDLHPEKMSQAIVKLLMNDEKRHELGEKGRNTICEVMKEHRKRWVDLFKNY
jgi:glycosyltransferase involved in cell wall biosynthesis